jgi:putative ABC transport system permease protein
MAIPRVENLKEACEMRIKHWFYSIPLRLRSLLRRSQVERELDEEFQYHLERQTQEYIAKGMTAEEARYAALRAMGGIEQRKEECRDMRRVSFIDDLLRDLRYGLRALRKNPGFAIGAILTLALGIGANTAIFSVINAVLLRPLPFREPDRLVHIWQTHPALGPTQTTYLDYVDWRKAAKSFQGMSAYTFQATNQVPLLGEGEPEQIQATMVAHDLLSIVGVKMLQGRSFAADDEERAQRVVLISERLWRRKFGADPGVIGRAIQLGPSANTVIGVVPDREAFPSWADVWMPLSYLEPMLRETRRFRPLEVVARLKDGVSVEDAHSEISTIASNIGRTYPETNQKLGASVVPLLDKITGKARPTLLVVWMAVGLVLLVACANMAHLLLARTISRRRELAIRLSLGAAPGHILRLLLIESASIVAIGGLLGAVLASFLMPTLQSLAAHAIPRVGEAGFDTAVLSFTLAAIVITTLVIALPSYWEMRRANLSLVTRQGDAHLFSQRSGRLGPMLMASEVALAFVAFAAALLLVRSFSMLTAVPAGFKGEKVLAVDLSLSHYGSGSWERARQTFETKLAPEIAKLPGVQAVATANMAPMSLDQAEISRYTTRFAVPGAQFEPGAFPVVQVRWVSEDYFKALDIPLLSGRSLRPTDLDKPRNLINETLARRFFAGQNPIGKQLLLNADTPQPQPVEIVGVVGDVRDLGLDIEAQPAIYSINTSPRFSLLVRSSTDPISLAAGVREIVHRADPEATIARVSTVAQIVNLSLSRHRFALWLMVGFACLAAALSVIGIYGVTAFAVGRRAREFAIRAALGARPAGLALLVLREGIVVSLAGMGAGLVLIWATSRLIRSVLFTVSPGDPAAMAGAGLLIIALCALSLSIPARRASSADPAATLKEG